MEWCPAMGYSYANTAIASTYDHRLRRLGLSLLPAIYKLQIGLYSTPGFKIENREAIFRFHSAHRAVAGFC